MYSLTVTIQKYQHQKFEPLFYKASKSSDKKLELAQNPSKPGKITRKLEIGLDLVNTMRKL